MSRTASEIQGAWFAFELVPVPQDTPVQSPISLNLTQHDRREKPRQMLRVQARIKPDGDTPLDAHTADLSLHGVAITSTRPLNVNQECDVELAVGLPSHLRPPALRAMVRYCARLRDEFRIGMKFMDLSIEAAESIVAALEP